MSKLKLFRRTTIKDKNGKIKYDSGLVPSNSYVIQFLEHIYVAFKDSSMSAKDISNSSETIENPSGRAENWAIVDAGDNVSNHGIVVGSGSGGESNTDYALGTQISHGTGAGELDYGAHSWTAPAVVGSNVDMIISRDFYNGSGGNVTVNEIGIYCKTVFTADKFFCIARDVLGSSQTVADTETLTVQYTLRTTV